MPEKRFTADGHEIVRCDDCRREICLKEKWTPWDGDKFIVHNVVNNHAGEEHICGGKRNRSGARPTVSGGQFESGRRRH
jgi:hypothetical protein